jgi:DNA-binding FadR family transcriptional regulator
MDQMTLVSRERATASLVYRAILRAIRDGLLTPGGKLPNERELALQFQTSRTAVRQALGIMEREGLVHRRVGAGTFLTDDAETVLARMDDTTAPSHEHVPSLTEIVEARLLFEPAMMHLVVARAEPEDFAEMRQLLDKLLEAPTWGLFKEGIYALHRRIFEATRNRLLLQTMDMIIAVRRAVSFDGRDWERPTPTAVRRQTHKDLSAIVEALAVRDAKLAESLIDDHLTRTLAVINI